MRLPDREPQPTCPECGRKVHPKNAIVYGTAKTLHQQVLEGVYCCSDHILDAIARRYPQDRARRA